MRTGKMGIYDQVLGVVSLQQRAPKIDPSHRALPQNWFIWVLLWCLKYRSLHQNEEEKNA